MKAESAICSAYDDHSPRDSAEPERNLMRAILRTAMEDIRKSGEVYRDARTYLLSDEDYYLFSFVSICDHLSVCHKTIRTLCGLRDGTTSERVAA